MNKRRIAVEDNLTPVRDLLTEKGYDVVGMDSLGSVSCVVVTGGGNNFMGIQNTLTEVPVINAEGRTAEEIVSEIEKTARLK